MTLGDEPAIKEPGNSWLLGKELPRMDVPVKVNGSAAYVIDPELEGTVYAAVKKSAGAVGGSLVNYDASAVD